MSALSRKRPNATGQRNNAMAQKGHYELFLLDDLVRLGGQIRRHLEAEHLGGLEVDDELKFGRLHHRQVSGLLALENPPGVDTDLAIAIAVIGAVAHQTTRLCVFALLVDGRDSVPRRQSNDFVALTVEELIGGDQHRSGVQLHCCCKRGIDLTLVARKQYMSLLASGGRCFLNLPCLVGVIRTVRIEEYSDQMDSRKQRTQQAKSLALQRSGQKIHARSVAPGTAEAGDEAELDRVNRNSKDNRPWRS